MREAPTLHTCQGCGEEFVQANRGRPRKWCSERCRKTTLYGFTCRDCGKRIYSGYPDPDHGRCGECQHEREYGERNRRILELWEEGAPGSFIAEELGISYNQVRGLIEHRRHRYGELIPLHRRRNREAWPLIERRYHEGLTYSEIADELGDCTPQNIARQVRFMREAGYDLPPRDMGTLIARGHGR